MNESLGHILQLIQTAPGLLKIRVETLEPPFFAHHNAVGAVKDGVHVVVSSAEGDWIKGEPQTVLEALLSHLATAPLAVDSFPTATARSRGR